MFCRICVKYAHLVHLLHFYLPQGANFRKFYSKGSILPGSACTCREKRSGKEGKHPSTSTSSLNGTHLWSMNECQILLNHFFRVSLLRRQRCNVTFLKCSSSIKSEDQQFNSSVGCFIWASFRWVPRKDTFFSISHTGVCVTVNAGCRWKFVPL